MTVKFTLATAQALAQSKGGVCLSTSYENSLSKLSWECTKGHLFSATIRAVLHDDTWCPKCSGYSKYSLQQTQSVAAAKGGRCLSTVYSGVKPLFWECQQGHSWSAKACNVLGSNQSWCPYCAHKVPKTIEEMRAIAEQRGGRCLSEACSKVEEALRWQCKKGHEWLATPHAVTGSPSRLGTWCPTCCEHKEEAWCRKIFEEYLGKPFPKTRPAWLVSSRGGRLELDGYCLELGIAFEYQGAQHYQQEVLHKATSKRPNPTTQEFAWQLQRDSEKRTLCREMGVALIEIPWHTRNKKHFIRKQLDLVLREEM